MTGEETPVISHVSEDWSGANRLDEDPSLTLPQRPDQSAGSGPITPSYPSSWSGVSASGSPRSP